MSRSINCLNRLTNCFTRLINRSNRLNQDIHRVYNRIILLVNGMKGMTEFNNCIIRLTNGIGPVINHINRLVVCLNRLIMRVLCRYIAESNRRSNKSKHNPARQQQHNALTTSFGTWYDSHREIPREGSTGTVATNKNTNNQTQPS